MGDVVGAPDFQDSLSILQAHLPDWWRTDDPTSNLWQVVTAAGAAIDSLAPLWQRFAGDTALVTATEEGMVRNFAFAWGLQNEQLPPTSNILSPYIQAQAADNGSPPAALATLTAFLGSVGDLYGPYLVLFDPGGAGLTFPANGSGITLWQYAGAGGGPLLTFPLTFPASGGLTMWQYQIGATLTGGLVFPSDGSGLIFPLDPQTFPSDTVVVNTGQAIPTPGSGLIFPVTTGNVFLSISVSYSSYTWTVSVPSVLPFDRAAFARAVERLRPAHFYPATIVEV
jgi:hypothetical protein